MRPRTCKSRPNKDPKNLFTWELHEFNLRWLEIQFTSLKLAHARLQWDLNRPRNWTEFALNFKLVSNSCSVACADFTPHQHPRCSWIGSTKRCCLMGYDHVMTDLWKCVGVHWTADEEERKIEGFQNALLRKIATNFAHLIHFIFTSLSRVAQIPWFSWILH